MHEASKNVIMVMIFIFSSIIAYQTLLLVKGIIKENKKHNELNNLEFIYSNYDESSYFNIINNKRNELHLYGNNTFKIVINSCEDVIEFTGLYSKENEKITLRSNTEYFRNNNINELNFTSNNDKEIKLNNKFYCLKENINFFLS